MKFLMVRYDSETKCYHGITESGDIWCFEKMNHPFKGWYMMTPAPSELEQERMRRMHREENSKHAN